jgi:multiple sugar transport system permease protein/raffinose/stachyose/melibiose transport system permease protein
MENRKEFTLTYTILIIGSIFILIPIFYMIGTSFKSMSEILRGNSYSIIPADLSIDGYKNILRNYPILTFLKNSVVSTFTATLITVCFATLGAYGFSRFEFRTKKIMMFFILVTQMFPSAMLFVPFYRLLSIYHLTKSILGIILVYSATALPFCTWMMYGYFQSIPKELNQAASIDGCGTYKTFLLIITPLTIPGLISTTLYSFLHCWNEYMFTMILANSEAQKTLTVAIGDMAGYDNVLWNDLMAAATLSCLPLIILFVFLQKYFISTLVSGAVKE